MIVIPVIIENHPCDMCQSLAPGDTSHRCNAASSFIWGTSSSQVGGTRYPAVAGSQAKGFISNGIPPFEDLYPISVAGTCKTSGWPTLDALRRSNSDAI